MNETFWLILALGIATYATRSLGYLIVSQFGTLHPRVLAALDAVPAAVITTIVLPPVIEGGLAERLTFVIAVLLSLRLSMPITLAISIVVLGLLRAFIG
ncbi:MAG: AzlD domain-containing protein [Hyphomicrobiales bacterium]